jgi:type VI secretion system protein ImpH
MADSQRRSEPGLNDQLFNESFRFSFFQAVRLLERMAPERVPVGEDGPCSREIVRFAQHLTLEFPSSSIHELEKDYLPRGARRSRESMVPADGDGVDKPPRMTTSFIGLVGPLGVLPTVYTEELTGSAARHRGAAVDFLDLFHHRITSLFYRAWEKYNLPTLWEKGATAGSRQELGGDAFTRHLFDFLGLGLDSLRHRQAYPDASLLYQVGNFTQQHRSAVMLEKLLNDYFGHPVKVLSFSGQWLRIEPEQRSRSGRRGVFNALGQDVVIGRKMWDVQSKFRVRIGPLDFDRFRELTPGGAASDRLMQMIRFYVRGEFDFDVQLLLEADEVPFCRATRDESTAARLGRHAWLKKREFEEAADEAIFRPGD